VAAAAKAVEDFFDLWNPFQRRLALAFRMLTLNHTNFTLVQFSRIQAAMANLEKNQSRTTHYAFYKWRSWNTYCNTQKALRLLAVN
jgi:hypothetical protein